MTNATTTSSATQDEVPGRCDRAGGSSPAGRPKRTRAEIRTRTALAAMAASLALVGVPVGSAQADWESDFHQSNTYWSLQGNLVIPDFESKVGRTGRRPYRGVTDVDVTGGLRLLFGHRVIPYLAFEVAIDYLAGVEFEHDGGSEEIDVLTGSIHFKGYPFASLLDPVGARIQPYFYIAPGIVGAAGASSQTPIHVSVGLGGGVDFWINDAYSLQLDCKYTWSIGNLSGLDYTTLGIGGTYHFY